MITVVVGYLSPSHSDHDCNSGLVTSREVVDRISGGRLAYNLKVVDGGLTTQVIAMVDYIIIVRISGEVVVGRAPAGCLHPSSLCPLVELLRCCHSRPCTGVAGSLTRNGQHMLVGGRKGHVACSLVPAAVVPRAMVK